MSNLLNIKDQSGNWIPIPVVTNGIKSITQNEDYTLTITLNDGTTYTTTSIKGEDGQDYILTENDKEEIAGLVDAPVDDVRINGTSIVQNGVANIPVADVDTLGAVKVNANYGVKLYGNQLTINQALDSHIKSGSGSLTPNRPITPDKQHMSVFYGLAKAAGADEKNSTLPVGQYTESAKSAISSMLNAPESVSGMTPTITAKAGVRYICGECTTLDITTPESGIVDITFISGATPTVLTVTPPTGMTMMWANGFDSTALEANTVYEINIMDGCKGVACSWT